MALLLVTLAGSPARPAGAQAPQTWQVQVDNVSPEGRAWQFNDFYPVRLQAHAGDTLTFRVADNPSAFHNVSLLPTGVIPVQAYPGFMFPDPYEPGGLMTTFFVGLANIGQVQKTDCGRAGHEPCTFNGQRPLNSGMLVVPPAGSGGQGNRSFTTVLDPSLTSGTYFFLCLVHGPAMSGSLDILPATAPAQRPAALESDAQRAYAADLARLAQFARALETPGIETNQDSSRTWSIAAGGARDPRLSVDEFGVRELVIKAGDTVTWSMQGPAGMVHSVGGFAARDGEPAPWLPVYDLACEAPVDSAATPQPSGNRSRPQPVPRTGVRVRPDPNTFAPDIWDTCPGRELALLTTNAFPTVPTGSSYTSGSVSSGILMSPDFLAGPVGEGLPFATSYSLRFDTPGTYRYTCGVHRGMEGMVVVLAGP